MTRFMSNQRKYTLDSVLSQLSCPLLLVWGDLDPWVGPAKALRIKEFYPGTSLVNLQAGHCPHDEVPELVNKALLEWLPTITSTPIPQATWTSWSSFRSVGILKWLIYWYIIEKRISIEISVALFFHLCFCLSISTKVTALFQMQLIELFKIYDCNWNYSNKNMRKKVSQMVN